MTQTVNMQVGDFSQPSRSLPCVVVHSLDTMPPLLSGQSSVPAFQCFEAGNQFFNLERLMYHWPITVHHFSDEISRCIPSHQYRTNWLAQFLTEQIQELDPIECTA